MKVDLGFYTRERCSQEESDEYRILIKEKLPLPEDVGYNPQYNYYFRYKEASDEDLQEYLSLLQFTHIRTIKNCVVFFTILSIIGIILALIAIIS